MSVIYVSLKPNLLKDVVKVHPTLRGHDNLFKVVSSYTKSDCYKKKTIKVPMYRVKCVDIDYSFDEEQFYFKTINLSTLSL